MADPQQRLDQDGPAGAGTLDAIAVIFEFREAAAQGVVAEEVGTDRMDVAAEQAWVVLVQRQWIEEDGKSPGQIAEPAWALPL